VARTPLAAGNDDDTRDADSEQIVKGVHLFPGLFKRFHQKNDVFCRTAWDETVQSEKANSFFRSYANPVWRNKGSGFRQEDFALRNAAWHITDFFAELYEADADRREGFLDPLTSVLRPPAVTQFKFSNPRDAAMNMKRTASVFGADSCGITDFDERFMYKKRFSRNKMEEKDNSSEFEGLHKAIVITTTMDHGLLSTTPSALSGAATGMGYGTDTFILLSMAQYIRNLGYEAVPSMNDAALAIPYALKAGLGEYGRNGLLITPHAGPRVRIGKIFTNLPMENDPVADFGVHEFCQICDRCAQACPAQAISFDQPSTDVLNISNIEGVSKWSVDGEACFSFWTKIQTECSVCIRVCPYNRTGTFWDKLWLRLAGSRFRRVALWIDDITARGRRERPADWWAAVEEHKKNPGHRQRTRNLDP